MGPPANSTDTGQGLLLAMLSWKEQNWACFWSLAENYVLQGFSISYQNSKSTAGKGIDFALEIPCVEEYFLESPHSLPHKTHPSQMWISTAIPLRMDRSQELSLQPMNMYVAKAAAMKGRSPLLFIFISEV